MQAEGMPEQRVSIRPVERLGQNLDVTVADRDLSAGKPSARVSCILSHPERCLHGDADEQNITVNAAIPYRYTCGHEDDPGNSQNQLRYRGQSA